MDNSRFAGAKGGSNYICFKLYIHWVIGMGLDRVIFESDCKGMPIYGWQNPPTKCRCYISEMYDGSTNTSWNN